MTTGVTQDNEPWVKKIRTKYDTIRNFGEKYAVLRKCKNRLDPFTGQFTLDEVSKRTTILASTLRKFESGGLELQDAIIKILLKDLDFDEQRFRYGEIVAQPAYPQPVPAPKAAALPPKAPPVTAPVETLKKSAPRQRLEIVNNTTDSFVVSADGGTIQIFADLPENARKGIWVAPADLVAGGTKILPRKTIVE